MRNIQHSVRIPLAQDRALRQLATVRQSTPYALLQQCVRAGLAQLSGEGNATLVSAELVREVGLVRAQLAHAERLTERALYVACAAYAYSRVAASGRVDEAKLAQEITHAFDRQLHLAGEK
jgi:hypothetical protein